MAEKPRKRGKAIELPTATHRLLKRLARESRQTMLVVVQAALEREQQRRESELDRYHDARLP